MRITRLLAVIGCSLALILSAEGFAATSSSMSSDQVMLSTASDDGASQLDKKRKRGKRHKITGKSAKAQQAQ